MSFHKAIVPHVRDELRAAAAQMLAHDPAQAFQHLERAHVLGQASTRLHVQVHWRMLIWALQQRQPREIIGQIMRIVGAASKTGLGLVPAGNSGGSNVSPFRTMPIPADLAAMIATARHKFSSQR